MPDSYIICTTPRTGSTLLCDLLSATAVAGDPDSFFMRGLDPAWAERWGLPAPGSPSAAEHDAACLAAAVRAGQGRTGIFGLRLMQRDLEDLSARIGRVFPGPASDSARFEAAFGRILYFHLARADTLAQAASLVRAEQTGLWHAAPDGTEIERLAPPKAPEYDFGRIARTLARLERYDAAWRAWFEAQGIAPLRIEYESLAADPAAAVARILDALDVGPPAASPEPGVARLADAVSLEWMRRYRQDVARRAADRPS